MSVVVRWKGSAHSGWWAPPRGTHTGEKHRSVGSGKSRKIDKKKPKPSAAIPAQQSGIEQSALNYLVFWIARDPDINEDEARSYIPDIENNIKAEMEGADVAVFAPRTAAEQILSDGKFRNQYETGTSEGVFGPKSRMEAEKDAWVIEGENPQSFPIYGVVRSKNYNPDSVSQYGRVEFVMKPSVTIRSTYTVGDSLDGFINRRLMASPIGQISAASVADIDAFTVAQGDWDSFWGPMGSYIEAQIHGGVTTSDISKMIIHMPSNLKLRSAYTPVAMAAAQKGIPVEYQNPK